MPSLRTGSLGLDILLGGGWKPGTINEIWGEPGTGKTTIAEHALLEMPAGRKAMWVSIGTEIPHRPTGALVAQPRNAEQAFYLMETCVLGDVKLIVVDSANGLVRQRELDDDPDYVPHPQREYASELNGLKSACQMHGAIVIFLSKPRDRDRQPVRGTGISEKSKDRVRLKLMREHQDGSREISASVHGQGEETVIGIDPGTGIDWSTELVHLAIRYELAKVRSSWIEYRGEKFQGTAAFSFYLEENGDACNDLDEEIRRQAGI